VFDVVERLKANGLRDLRRRSGVGNDWVVVVGECDVESEIADESGEEAEKGGVGIGHATGRGFLRRSRRSDGLENGC
jgi:hypothetical protein